ncbi:MAG: type II toxin-antitoxin system Phd/YefM family antitoxin [Eubacteriales bacterium]|nr:type II toxin-antitoxin system Phd/YefM family antitoxin [Eubacteriales bacterium]
MPEIRPISDLRNKANEISEFCRESREPVYITKNGAGDMVVMSIETFERMDALIQLYAKLAATEEEIARGGEGEDFFQVAKELRNNVHGI